MKRVLHTEPEKRVQKRRLRVLDCAHTLQFEIESNRHTTADRSLLTIKIVRRHLKIREYRQSIENFSAFRQD